MTRSRFLCLTVLALFVSLAPSLSAASPACSVHPKKGATADELKSLAKLSQDDARKAALATLKDPSKATIKEAELEAEHGCLVYSFDIEIAGAKGIQEVQIDAGDGKVLSSEHESPKAEAAEKAKDKAKS